MLIADKLQSRLTSLVERGQAHGVVVTMQSYDKTFEFTGAAGSADAETGRAMTPETPFFIASVTKMFTAVIAIGLHEENQLDLDAPLGSCLPSELIRSIHVLNGVDYSERITVRQLINQTSGLADYETGKPRGGQTIMARLKAGQDVAVSTPEALDIVRRMSPKFPPGTPGKAHYANTNYRLLGEIIESVTGRPMAENFHERIGVKLGLEQTYLFNHAVPREGPAPATIYMKDVPARIPKYLSSNVSDGGLVSTASECLVFLRALFEGRLISAASLSWMQTWTPIFFPLSYGYGLMNFRLPRYFWPTPLPQFIGHSGTSGSFAFTCPSQSLYLAGTLNQVSPAKPFSVMMDLLRTFNRYR